MILKNFIIGKLETNCYILGDETSKDALCIDPGGRIDEIMAAVNKAKLSIKYIINTHGHFDHVGGNGLLKKTTGAKLAIHSKDIVLLESAALQGAAFEADAVASPPPDMLLKDGDKIQIGNLMVSVMHTPGHSQGGICLFVTSTVPALEKGGIKSGILFTGDTLFAGSIGRTDLPGGSYKEIIASIKNKILPLGDEVRVFPGHGPETTIGREKKFNQFLIEAEA